MCRSLLLVSLLAAAPAWAVDFETDVEPIFHERCYACHGPSNQMSGFRLDDREAALAGGYSGAVIRPGDSAASALIQRVTSDKDGFRMPPAGPPLSDAETAKLAAWIDAGAEWPERAPAPKLTSEQKAEHWSFQPITRPGPPAVQDSAWVRNPIDRFVLAKLEAEGVRPSPETDKATLARRVSFDLTGLPPSPERVARFVADERPEAYAELVDELLASDHYAEKWAMHWLDAARYADSEGYERDPLRPHAWRWRDWVINAVGSDMPFDEFTIEQLAGDLLPDADLDSRIATGFLRNGIKNREAGVAGGEKRFEEVLDRTNTVGEVWLGLTVGCAQCHDHKYDPISQKEMYQLFAYLDNAVERDIEAPAPGEWGPFLRRYAEYRSKREAILEENGIPELYAAFRAEMIEAMDHPGERTDWDFQLTEWRAANDRSDWLLRAEEGELTDIERDKRIDHFLARKGPVINKDEGLEKKLDAVREELEKLESEMLPYRTQAYTMIERSEPVATHIALRGDWRAPGLEVQPGTPAVLPAPESPAKTPSRLELARWLVADSNPLTARVTVNHWWQELFGVGVVSTPDDFGTQGAPPTHPELLDWLASELRENGWSRKKLLRTIVLSATYRQASDDRPELAERDPANEWLARQNRLRLPAELIRDNALAVSGLLNDKVGGESVHPPQPEGISELSYSAKAWPEDTGPDRYRRGMYIFFRRTSPYPMLTNFDAPDTLTASVERERTNTPLQALNLLNDPVFFEAAQALGVRVMLERDETGERLERLFRLTLARAPEAGEKDRASTFLAAQREALGAAPGKARDLAPFVPEGATQAEAAAWTLLARGMLNLDEFLTRE